MALFLIVITFTIICILSYSSIKQGFSNQPRAPQEPYYEDDDDDFFEAQVFQNCQDQQNEIFNHQVEEFNQTCFDSMNGMNDFNSAPDFNTGFDSGFNDFGSGCSGFNDFGMF